MFRTKEIKTHTLGEKLKEARQKMKITLEQVSMETNIFKSYLEYLEKGDYKRLPADIYVIAYLKKYAQILNLNTEEILNQFKSEKGIVTNLPNSSKSGKMFIITPKKLTLVGGILIISLIFGYFWHQLSYLINPPVIKITQPALDLTIYEKSTEIFGQTDPDVYLTINDKEVYVDSRGYFQSVINLELGLNTLRIKVKDRFGKTNTIIRRVMVVK